MANQNNDDQRRNRGCGCGGHDERKEHKEHKDHKEHKEEHKCKENCAATECEIAQEKMVLYNYVQAVDNAVLGDPTLLGASNIPLGGLYLAAYNVTATDQAANTFSVLPYIPAAIAVFPALPTLPTNTIVANPPITTMSDPFTPVITGTVVTADVLSFPNILPAGLTYDGLLGVNSANYAAFTLDPKAVCCWSTVKAYITLNNLFAVLPEAPHVDPIITLNSCDILAIAEYILTKVNELCLPEFAKANIADKLVSAVQKIISKFAGSPQTGPGCSFNTFDNGFGLCRSDEIPECGPIFIDSSDPILIQFLLYAKFLLRSYFITGCDCDITFEHACQFVFGRFCVIDVFVPKGITGSS
ncbi:MAG: hypothetical protein Terrestrivirus9_12 [Terrestrivirus sp.]|uniref:Uncharacterized protein n=1 Tax=Terrestrivirus sp. TaxID=2487775 RepID=A0A3G4ZNX4_9VIRU|nr:MAG: hypothetical protein Terrestrivirus9_12 [Terrestrivirus sp.]